MRGFWIVFGLGSHALFALTVWRLVPFLQGDRGAAGLLTQRPGLTPNWFWFDLLLAVQFGVLHSGLLLPWTRKRLERFIPSPQYGCFFCAVTCLSLLLAVEAWQPSPAALWRLEGAGRTAVTVAFVLAWVALLYSLSLAGFGYQTGWTPWWAWLRGRAVPRRQFAPRGAFRLLRHPVYLSLLALVWLTPGMTLDRAVLVAVWTVYVFIGSSLKDRRLVHYLGATYRQYQARVPGYPFVPFGPLGKVSWPGSAETAPSLARAAVPVRAPVEALG